jgi:hypothetical protein
MTPHCWGQFHQTLAKGKWQKVTSKLQLRKSQKYFLHQLDQIFVRKYFVKWLFSFVCHSRKKAACK